MVAYGERGRGFIECHHTRPLHTLRPGDKTKIADLVLVCSNCHWMFGSLIVDYRQGRLVFDWKHVTSGSKAYSREDHFNGGRPQQQDRE
ncbi:HNH endonuclease [Roseococcus sp.]|uniref:HNH endonuclease n=1 Tax=Roseococcus sp. TaxID=2109646 RepID=UPI003BA89B15